VEIAFTPSPDVVVILNALLDKFENRAKHNPMLREAKGTYHASRNISSRSEAEWTNHETRNKEHATRSIKIALDDLCLPSYFSQIDPQSRLIANQQLQTLEQNGLLHLHWLPGETNHLLHSISLSTEHEPRNTPHAPRPTQHIIPKRSGVDEPRNTQHAPRPTQHESLYKLLQRTPISNHRANLESNILAEKFRYQKSDWRARALDYILDQLHAGKSPSPFSLTDSDFNLDLLAVLQALSTLTTETPYRVFSVRVFNNTKRFDDLKPALIRLARRANPEWKSLHNEDLLHELNLVANPTYIHLSGNWELTDINGQIINLDSFTPSVGFPASQIASIQRITIRAESVLCIENLTSFHQQVDRYTSTQVKTYTGKQVNTYTGKHAQADNAPRPTPHAPYHPEAKRSGRSTQHATLCLMGNPSPAIRHLLNLISETVPIYLWSDMDYGGFNILAQLRKQVSPRIQPFLMDIATFENYAHLSRPLTQADARNLKRLTHNPILKDIHPLIERLLQRGLKLEQEAITIST